MIDRGIAVGDGGVVIEKIGFGDAPFEPVPSAAIADLHAVAVLDARQAYAVGAAGAAQRYHAETKSWQNELGLGPTTAWHGAVSLPSPKVFTTHYRGLNLRPDGPRAGGSCTWSTPGRER